MLVTTIASVSGNFSFSNVVSGSYTINASGTDGSNIHYAASVNVTISGNQQNIAVNAVAG